MTTLNTPSPEQWRKLCEMAGLFVTPDGIVLFDKPDSTKGYTDLHHLPSNTESLMRLLDELVDNWVLCTFTRGITKPPFITLEVWRNDWFSIVDRPISGDRNETRRLAARDILYQLAVAEGIE